MTSGAVHVCATRAMHDPMNRNQAIDDINAHLSSHDDERAQTIAKIVQSMAAPDDLPRTLTARELALIEQSKEDFKAGRVYSVE